MAPPTDRFASSGSGRFVDIGAGSGRATIGLLLARPRVHVTAVDIYKGYYGIDDNRPERLIRNASIAGVADRVSVVVGDARALPLETGSLRRRHQCGGYRPSSPRWNSQSTRGSRARPQAARRISAGRRERRLVGAGGVTACARASSEQGSEPVAIPARVRGVQYRRTGNAAGRAVFSVPQVRTAEM